MIHRWLRKIGWLPRIRVLFLAAFAYPIGLWALCECIHAVRAEFHPVRAGVIENREEIRRLGGIPAARYEIRLEETGERVHAVLAASQLHGFPAKVKLRYSGNPQAEVRLVGEESPWLALLVTILMWGLPVVLLGLYAKFGDVPGDAPVIPTADFF